MDRREMAGPKGHEIEPGKNPGEPRYPSVVRLKYRTVFGREYGAGPWPARGSQPRWSVPEGGRGPAPQ